MALRRNILPRCISDAFVTLFVMCIIPIVYYFELFIVLPRYYVQWSPAYMFHFVSGSFIMFNVCSNLVAVMIYDTSIKGRMLPSAITGNWRFCSVCECLCPPRSWHCGVCNTCILKRDHHCMFTSCCIGHHNQRYFLAFVFYIFAATVYASYYNISFIWDFVEFNSWESVLKVIFPLATLFVKYSMDQVYLFLVIIILIGCVFTAVLLVYHVNLIKRGVVTHERTMKLSSYDFGVKRNVVEVFGERWYLVWISPFFDSKLPGDGIVWNVRQTEKAK